MFAGASPFIRLIYGEDFLASSIILQIFLPGVVFISLWKILINDLNARGKPSYYSLSALIAVIIMVSLDFILITFKRGNKICDTAAVFDIASDSLYIENITQEGESRGIKFPYYQRWFIRIP